MLIGIITADTEPKMNPSVRKCSLLLLSGRQKNLITASPVLLHKHTENVRHVSTVVENRKTVFRGFSNGKDACCKSSLFLCVDGKEYFFFIFISKSDCMK